MVCTAPGLKFNEIQLSDIVELILVTQAQEEVGESQRRVYWLWWHRQHEPPCKVYA